MTMADTSEYFIIIPPQNSVPPGHQICANCGAVRPLEEFYPRPVAGYPHRRHRQCKACQLAKARQRYATNPEPGRQRSRKYSINLDAAPREKRRAEARASYAQGVRKAGRPYQPRLKARKDVAVMHDETHKLVCAALAELARVEIFANGFIQGSRAAGTESDLSMLLMPLARAQAALEQILHVPSPTQAQPATSDAERDARGDQQDQALP